jgi:biopolymer transport protein ExbD
MKHSDIAHFRQLNSLRRRFVARSRRFPPSIEPAAMVDVVLLVLLFFMISSSYVTRPGVRIHLPESEFSEGIPMNAMVVTLTQQGLVFINDRRSSLEDLSPAFERMHAENPDITLVIEADERVTLGLDVEQVHPSASFALRLAVTRSTAAA